MTCCIRCLLFFFFALLPFTVSAQFQERGIPYGRYYGPREYEADPQNWVALQRSSGVMYFGNGDGIMTYNGERWNLTPLPNSNLVRSLCEKDDVLFIGGYSEIGFLREEMPGTPTYVTLTDKLPEHQRDFGHVWSAVNHHGSIYFTTDQGIFIWKESHFDSLIVESSYPRAFHSVCNDTMYIQPVMGALSIIQGQKVNPVKGGDFYSDKRITAIMPFSGGVKMICTLDHGVFLYDGRRSTPFETAAQSFLRTNRLYKAIRLSDGTYAFGTLNGGVVLLKHDGAIIQLLDKKSGLGDNAVYSLTEDREGGLWITHSVGITRVAFRQPFTWFDSRNGLEGAVNDIIRFEGDLYVGTMLGLYKLRPASSFEHAAKFEKVHEVSSSVWAMAARHGALLLITDDGTMQLKGGRFSVVDHYSGAVMHASSFDPDVVYVGLVDGIVRIE